MTDKRTQKAAATRGGQPAGNDAGAVRGRELLDTIKDTAVGTATDTINYPGLLTDILQRIPSGDVGLNDLSDVLMKSGLWGPGMLGGVATRAAAKQTGKQITGVPMGPATPSEQFMRNSPDFRDVHQRAIVARIINDLSQPGRHLNAKVLADRAAEDFRNIGVSLPAGFTRITEQSMRNLPTNIDLTDPFEISSAASAAVRKARGR